MTLLHILFLSLGRNRCSESFSFFSHQRILLRFLVWRHQNQLSCIIRNTLDWRNINQFFDFKNVLREESLKRNSIWDETWQDFPRMDMVYPVTSLSSLSLSILLLTIPSLWCFPKKWHFSTFSRDDFQQHKRKSFSCLHVSSKNWYNSSKRNTLWVVSSLPP